jgi:hypothetical protein
MQSMHPLQDRGGCLGMCMGTGALAAEGLEDGIYELDRGQLVVEDVGPRVAPLLRRGFELEGCQSYQHTPTCEKLLCWSKLCKTMPCETLTWKPGKSINLAPTPLVRSTVVPPGPKPEAATDAPFPTWSSSR